MEEKGYPCELRKSIMSGDIKGVKEYLEEGHQITETDLKIASFAIYRARGFEEMRCIEIYAMFKDILKKTLQDLEKEDV